MRKIMAVWGVANIGWAALSLMGLDMAGFPDGYISPYDRMTLLPLTVLAWAMLLVGIVMLARALFGRSGRLDLAMGIVAVILLYVPGAVIDACPRWSPCGTAFESVTGVYPDDGVGG